MTLATGSLLAQDAGPLAAEPSLPFGVGEELVYRASLGRFGGQGRGVMRVEAGEVVRGRATLLLMSDMRGRVAFFSAEDRTRSWFDPVSLRSLRFSKTERHPLSTWDESVELFPEERRWVANRDSGELTTDAPLDELSFIYFLRTLPLEEGDSLLFARHYDPERNPTRVRVIGRETITVPAGEFETLVVEMTVRDERRYGGEGVVRLNLTDDERRLPVRIASTMRAAGTTVLSLESVTAVTGHTAQR
ncbi:MAG TPA: DUF3108 domain-containing protein [Gemmatimonadaceae bacterium]